LARSVSRRKFLHQTTCALLASGLKPALPKFHEAPDLDFQIGQMLMANFPGLRMTESIAHLIRKEHLGGVLLFENNFSTASQPKESLKKLTNDLQNVSPTSLLIAMDQEGGAVNRLKQKYGFPRSYSAHYLGKRNDLQLTKQTAETTAKTLSAIGINQNFAPVVDLNINSDNPVVGSSKRCFSSDPGIVVAHSREIIRAHRERNIITTLKHFPGHGSSTNDSHAGFTDVTDTWDTIELTPYRELIAAGFVDSIMTAHIYNSKLDRAYPASLSQKTITTLLRKELGFEGVVFSDDLLMGAIRNQYSLEESVLLAILAGNDILLFTTIANELLPRVKSIIKKHIENGAISRKRINISYRRIAQLKHKLL